MNTYNAAMTRSSELLSEPNIKALINQREQQIQAKLRETTVITKEKIINDIERISQKAEEKEQFSPALKGKELIGKELGMFRDQQINLNVSLEDFIRQMSKQPDTIEVEAIDDKQ
jgi:hypothetical protein